MGIHCPIQPGHLLVEVAPGLHQCPWCGYGPSTSGYRPYWAISDVTITDNGDVDAICVRFDVLRDCYVMSGVSWVVHEGDEKIHGTFIEGGSAVIPLEELETSPLPVVIRAKGKWELPTNKPKLVEGMFPTAQGLKEISLSDGRSSRSEG